MGQAKTRLTLKALTLCAVAGIMAPAGRAAAEIRTASPSTSGATCSGGGGGDGDCRNSVALSTANNGITFTSRYAWNINADTGIFSTHDTSGDAQHNLSLSVTAPGSYFLTVDTRRTGDMNRISDASGCDGSADTSATNGSQSGGTLSSGSLSLTDPGSIGNGGGHAAGALHQTNTAGVPRARNRGNEGPHPNVTLDRLRPQHLRQGSGRPGGIARL